VWFNKEFNVEQVEAYRSNDSASHGRFGITPRTAPVVRCFFFSHFWTEDAMLGYVE
jgi:hypothetical protein